MGISGLTIAGAGIWAIFGTLVAWWIKGMADRRRARNEGVTVESAANKVLIDNLTAEIRRMQARLEEQDKRITALEGEKRDRLDRESVLRADNIRLEAIIQSRGEVRQRAAQVVAADRAAEHREAAG
ncbi:MAG: hypothetical protein WC889_02770 [Myxococcota bacterium]